MFDAETILTRRSFVESSVLVAGLAIAARPAQAQSYPSSEELSEAYIDFTERVEQMGGCIQTSLEVFEQIIAETQLPVTDGLIEKLALGELDKSDEVKKITSENTDLGNLLADDSSIHDGAQAGSISSLQWYDDIGTSNPKLPRKPSYSTYNIYSNVKPADIVYETGGGWATLSGHIAIIEGKFYDSSYATYYVRTVEAISSHVTRGVLDDSRYVNRRVKMLCAPAASSQSIRSGITSFCVKQLGKNWSLSKSGSLSASANITSWYCSEMAWAAFYNQGLNLNGTTIPSHIYTPYQVYKSSLLISRSVV